MSEPKIRLHFLQTSRAIRIAWLLEELNLPYDVDFSNRNKGDFKAPQDWQDQTGHPIGKSPAIHDGHTLVHESGAITECGLTLLRRDWADARRKGICAASTTRNTA
jgi:glutathione S-transferase